MSRKLICTFAAALGLLCFGLPAAAQNATPVPNSGRVVYLSWTTSPLEANLIQMVDPAAPGVPQTLLTWNAPIQGLEVSPDGRKIAFVAQTTVDIGAPTTIQLLNLDTNVVTDISACRDVLCAEPAWRNDNSGLVYSRYQQDPANPEFYVQVLWQVNVDGSGNAPMTLPAAGTLNEFYAPHWAYQTGQQLAFSGADNRTDALRSIVVYDLAANTLRGYTPPNDYEEFQIAPTGDRIAYTRTHSNPAPQLPSGGIGLIDVATGAMSMGSDDTPGIEDNGLLWFPDGQRLIITRLVSEPTSGQPLGSQIYLLNPADRSVIPLVIDLGFANSEPQIDRDGLYMAYLHTPVSPDPEGGLAYGPAEVWVYLWATGERRQLASQGFNARWARA